ncbi:hypothetical protein KM043_017607 [Ampulex compressa]|nr:hypothetical protein KM043_017607 [Ampulex compressa]
MNEAGQEEAHITTPELIKRHGYVCETHNVWTEDEYCLEVHRVLPKKDKRPMPRGEVTLNSIKLSIMENYGKNFLVMDKPITAFGENDNSRPSVVLAHGILSSSADWVLLGPQNALAYILCDNGYDVWMPNARGNTYSKRHKQYTTKSKEFWNFSWHEIGYYDVPAVIDYILDTTNHTELYYIGYSQGTTSFYVMLSERPEYNAKIRGMISMAPIAFLANQRSPLLKCVVHFYVVMEWGSTYWNIHQWFPRNRLQARALSTLIRNAPYSLIKSICHCWFYLIAGFGSDQLEKSMLPLIFGHFPAGASAKQIVHYGQSILSRSFRKFDYGTVMNLKHYGSTQPPKYDLGRIKVPVAIFYSENDFLTAQADIQTLVNNLPNVVQTKKVEYAKFNHVDFLWGRDAKTLLYNGDFDGFNLHLGISKS